ncbi:MAG: hypothetical protein GXY48_06005 [Methanomicrobiales archaeon]|nr:hypothetical protein [Methanomicrobiales archaeon]
MFKTAIFIIISLICSSTFIPVSGLSDLIPGLEEYSAITPDLSLSSLIVSDNVFTNTDLTGSVIVANTGPVPATNVETTFVLIKNGSTSSIVYWLPEKTTHEMQPGLKGKVPFQFLVPEGIREGEYTVEATITSDEYDLFVADNTISSEHPVRIHESGRWKGEHPNLVVSIDNIDRHIVAPGSPLAITYTVRNLNDHSAGTYHIGFFLTQDNTLSSRDILFRDITSFSVNGLMNEEHTSLDLLPENIPDGEYYLVAVIDYTGMIPEVDESDNFFISNKSILVSSTEKPNLNEIVSQVTGLLYLKTNKYRQYKGLNELNLDSFLSSIADAHTVDMIKRNYFSHYTPEGLDPKGRADIAGYESSKKMDDGTIRSGIAENIIRIAAGYNIGKTYSGFVDPTLPEEIADIIMIEWINSPEHNKNLINPEIEKIGIGTRFDGEFFYATQNFF